MSENFELNISEREGHPCLYLHGLGSPDPISPEVESAISHLGYAVSNQWRNDQEVLNSTNPAELLQTEIAQAIDSIAQSSGEKVTVVGNSLGSYLALLGAAKVAKHIRGILGTDAFLTPNHGFQQMRDMTISMADDIKEAIAEDHGILSPFDELPERLKEAQKNSAYPVPLVNDRWITLPDDLASKFRPINEISGIKKIKSPIHLIWGKEDPFVIKSPIELIPGDVSGLELSDCNHNEWKENDRAKTSALEFLSTL